MNERQKNPTHYDNFPSSAIEVFRAVQNAGYSVQAARAISAEWLREREEERGGPSRLV